ncbi:unnamed protein product, partial [marine sediment metagenome]
NKKVALVTGGSRGIGKIIAIALAKEKMNIILTYKVNKDKAFTVVKEIKDKGGYYNTSFFSRIYNEIFINWF